MTHANRHNGIFSFIFIPLSIAFLLFGVFSVVWLRAGVRTVEYAISTLENKRKEALNEKKMLMAEKASLLSVQNIKSTGDKKLGLIFPDRVKVVYVKKKGTPAPYRASLTGRRLTEP